MLAEVNPGSICNAEQEDKSFWDIIFLFSHFTEIHYPLWREEKPQGLLVFHNCEFPATCYIYGYIISLHQDAVNTFAEVSILDLVQLLFSVVVET